MQEKYASLKIWHMLFEILTYKHTKPGYPTLRIDRLEIKEIEKQRL